MAENENNLPAAVDSNTGEANDTTNNADETGTNADDTNTASAETIAASTETTEQEEVSEEAPVSTEEITYHAVEKDGHVTAIWEMQGRKHLRTIDPRSRQGQEILRLYTSEHHDEVNPAQAHDADASQETPAAQDAATAQ